MKKRIISLAVAMCLATTQVGAFSNNWLKKNVTDQFTDNSFVNTVGGAMGTTSDGSSHYITTGSIYYRFGVDYNDYEPLWAVSGGSIQVGCGGFSLEGLWGQLISWDKLSGMLKNAGSSFAWGVVVGLVYSLPGVATVFDYINGWANKIQQLLGAACQNGVGVGRLLAEKGKDYVASSSIFEEGSTGQQIVSWTENAGQKINDWTTSTNQWWDSTFSSDGVYKGFTQSSQKVSDDKQRAALDALIAGTAFFPSLKTDFLMLLFHEAYAVGGDSVVTKMLQDMIDTSSINGDTDELRMPTYLILTLDESISSCKNSGKDGNGFKVVTCNVAYLVQKYINPTDVEKFMSLSFQTAMINAIAGDVALTEDGVSLQEKYKTCLGVGTKKTNDQRVDCKKTFADTLNEKNTNGVLVVDGAGKQDAKPLMQAVMAQLYKGANTTYSGLSNITTATKKAAAKIPALMYLVSPNTVGEQDFKTNKLYTFASVSNAKYRTQNFLGNTTTGGGLRGKAQRMWDLVLQLNNASNVSTSAIQNIESQAGIRFAIPTILQDLKYIQQARPDERKNIEEVFVDVTAVKTLMSLTQALTYPSYANVARMPLLLISNGKATLGDVQEQIKGDQDRMHFYHTAQNNAREAITKMQKASDEFFTMLDRSYLNQHNITKIQAYTNYLNEIKSAIYQRVLETKPSNPLY